MSFFDVIDKLVQESDCSEGFTPQLLEMVDLEIAYTPVIAIKGEGLCDEVEAIKTKGGKYLVRHPMLQHAVDAESLKRMRLRYLLKSKEQQSRQFAGLFGKLRQATEQAVAKDQNPPRENLAA